MVTGLIHQGAQAVQFALRGNILTVTPPVKLAPKAHIAQAERNTLARSGIIAQMALKSLAATLEAALIVHQQAVLLPVVNRAF